MDSQYDQPETAASRDTPTGPPQNIRNALVEYFQQNCDRILENLPFGHKQTLYKTKLKFFTMSSNYVFFAHLHKATIKPSCCKVSH